MTSFSIGMSAHAKIPVSLSSFTILESNFFSQSLQALGDTHLPPGVSIDSLLGDDSAVCSLSEPLSSAPGVGEKQLTVVTGEQPPERPEVLGVASLKNWQASSLVRE